SENMNNLELEVEASREHSDSAAKELEQLEGYTQQMQTIVELINNVADQTSLLALNASIEAARAGEAGRGFSVVATEISNLANQTQAATDDIQQLIANINHKLDDVAKAINTFIEGSAKQHDVALETVKSLGTIQTDTSSIEHNAEGLTTAVERLADANRKIVESIQNISAITEEVSAHSNETYESSRTNTETVNEMMGIVEHLNQQTALLHQN
ncbi:MAG: chemotaxis protein, partial [Lachnospiraceae bacterium]|nr:chemotaxis protein [Lachnospiraceae bacterium]